jgi:hypothetical protein
LVLSIVLLVGSMGALGLKPWARSTLVAGPSWTWRTAWASWCCAWCGCCR